MSRERRDRQVPSMWRQASIAVEPNRVVLHRVRGVDFREVRETQRGRVVIVNEEVICPECGVNLAIHCDVEAEYAALRKENEALRAMTSSYEATCAIASGLLSQNQFDEAWQYTQNATATAKLAACASKKGGES